MDLTDEQWALIEPVLTVPAPAHRGRGRPTQSTRAILNGIFFKLRTAARWGDLPAHYPSQQTCRRYLRHWTDSGVLKKVTALLVHDLQHRGGLNLQLAMQLGQVQFATHSGRLVAGLVQYPPDTWQGSTASVLLQLLLRLRVQTLLRGRQSVVSYPDHL